MIYTRIAPKKGNWTVTSWTLIYLFFYWIIGQENIIFSDVPKLFDKTLSPLNFIITVFIKPLDAPLWFIRNLFIMVVLSPILYFIINKTGFLLPFSLLVLTHIVHHSIIESFLWFTFGISFAVKKFDFLYFCHRWLRIIITIAILSVIVDFILYPHIKFHITSYFSIFKIMSVFGIGYWLVKKFPKIAKIRFLNDSSFTIYAYHGLAVFTFIPLIYNITNKIGGGPIMTYLLSIFLIVLIGIVLSIAINKNKTLRTFLCGR